MCDMIQSRVCEWCWSADVFKMKFHLKTRSIPGLTNNLEVYNYRLENEFVFLEIVHFQTNKRYFNRFARLK